MDYALDTPSEANDNLWQNSIYQDEGIVPEPQAPSTRKKRSLQSVSFYEMMKLWITEAYSSRRVPTCTGVITRKMCFWMSYCDSTEEVIVGIWRHVESAGHGRIPTRGIQCFVAEIVTWRIWCARGVV